jgi:hypothetical protein
LIKKNYLSSPKISSRVSGCQKVGWAGAPPTEGLTFFSLGSSSSGIYPGEDPPLPQLDAPRIPETILFHLETKIQIKRFIFKLYKELVFNSMKNYI